MTTTKEDMHQ